MHHKIVNETEPTIKTFFFPAHLPTTKPNQTHQNEDKEAILCQNCANKKVKFFNLFMNFMYKRRRFEVPFINYVGNIVVFVVDCIKLT